MLNKSIETKGNILFRSQLTNASKSVILTPRRTTKKQCATARINDPRPPLLLQKGLNGLSTNKFKKKSLYLQSIQRIKRNLKVLRLLRPNRIRRALKYCTQDFVFKIERSVPILCFLRKTASVFICIWFPGELHYSRLTFYFFLVYFPDRHSNTRQ